MGSKDNLTKVYILWTQIINSIKPSDALLFLSFKVFKKIDYHCLFVEGSGDRLLLSCETCSADETIT